ncbi:DUF6578 domain-containing protein [Streptomyces dysideae]|uniref:Uncharacterized protein n=1 Tax=Streptomyces dysideae TaxID=909626 RepID=A0A117S2S9_9ACTN|nr:DUF6578 domain-containing protein [Streptomyces dysideae]KUO23072.1 hypothetical protein AQJ91_00400 [Streptomyces dysideae]
MGLWHVFYEDWQMECCGTPFSVGDEVSWPMMIVDADAVLGGGWHDQLTKVVGVVEDWDGVRIVRDKTGLMVALGGRDEDDDEGEADGPRLGDPIRRVGLLSVETHGAEWPEVAGRVRAVQVLTQGYAEGTSAAWEPVPGERWLRAVDECPKWFADKAAGKGGDGRPRRRRDAGVVVALEVPGTDSWLSYAVREASGIPHEGAAPGAETEGLPEDALAALLETLSTVRGPGDG